MVVWRPSTIKGPYFPVKLRTVAIAVLLLGLLAAGAYWWVTDYSTRVPDVALTTTTGKVIRLPQLHGRPVLVTFWATTCPSCMKELPQMSRLYRDLSPRGLEMIGISVYYDPPTQVTEVMRAFHIPYPVVNDVMMKASEAFRMVRVVTPTTFLIDPDGHIVARYTGPLDFPKVRARIGAMLGDKTRTAALENNSHHHKD